MAGNIGAGATRLLARYGTGSGEIAVLEDPATGARLYREGGASQSYVLPGGESGLDYIALMADLLERGPDALLFGCGGGALATALHRRGCTVTMVDSNALSFEIARRYFWMPPDIACVSRDMEAFLDGPLSGVAAIGVDVGGPGFDYDAVLNPGVCARLAERLAEGGRLAINIACDWAAEGTIKGVGAALRQAGLDVRLCEEIVESSCNSVLVGSNRPLDDAALQATASTLGFRVIALPP